jgi:hypothetical protein
MTLLVVSVVKFLLVRSLLSMGVPRELLQAQDAIIAGALTAALVWALLIAERVRRRQEEEQIRVVADLNHHLRNALEIIFGSEYLRESEKATAILESVKRIDTALQVLLAQPPAPGAGRWRKVAMRVHAAEERRKAARTPTERRVTIRFPYDGHSELTGTARDVSVNGIFVQLDAGIAVGTEVEILLTLPTESGEVSTSIRGNVVRVERASVGASGIGIAFATAA